jgi:putative membrane protein
MIKSKALIGTLMIVGVCVLLGGLSSAHQGNMNGNANGGGTSQGANSNTTRNEMARSADGKFMMTAAAGGMAEVEMARLAQERGSSDAVKQYAQRMIDDHTSANQELMQVASTKGITLPTGPDAKHMALMERLRGLTGADFDRTYIKEAGVKDHENMEKLFRNETTKGKDADVMAFATKTLPAVQDHLRMARELSGTTGANRGGGSGGMGGNTNGNANMNGNGNMNGNTNRNANRNRNGNANGNMNGNTNGNMNNSNTNP